MDGKICYQKYTWSEFGNCKHDKNCHNRYCLYSHTPLDKCIFGEKCTNRHCRYSHPVRIYRGLLSRHHCKICYTHTSCITDDNNEVVGYLNRKETPNGIIFSMIQPMGN